MKMRTAAWILTVGLLLLPVGCASSSQLSPPAVQEVLTFEKTPPGRIQITMRCQDGINIQRIESVIETQFPMVDIIMVCNTAGKIDIENNHFQDIFLTSFPSRFQLSPQDKFIDFSTEAFLSNYALASLNDCQIDGKIYYLPGPLDFYGILYDRELFAQHGWELPHNLDEFIALCQEIQQAGIRPLQVPLESYKFLQLFFAGFTYDTLYAGTQGYQWLRDFRTGKQSMLGNTDATFETLTRLLDAGIWKAEDFNANPTQVANQFYTDKSYAMIIGNQMTPIYAQELPMNRSLGMMPFYSGDEDSDYFISSPNFFIAANKALQQPGQEEKLQTVMEIISYLSSKEGQIAIIDDSAPMISNVKGVTFHTPPFLEKAKDTLEKGHVVPWAYFIEESNDVDHALQAGLKALALGEATPQQVASGCDTVRDSYLEKGHLAKPEMVASALTDFTVLQTSEYIADVFRRKAGTEIGLCMANTLKYGCNASFYEGNILVNGYETIDTFLDKGFYDPALPAEKQKLTRISITGKDLLYSLQFPYCNDSRYPSAYYVSSGLKIVFAPWVRDGQRILSVTLADGSHLLPDAVYEVAVWNGSIDPRRIRKIEAFYDDSFHDLLIETLKNDKSIRPFDDGRFRLDWETSTETSC